MNLKPYKIYYLVWKNQFCKHVTDISDMDDETLYEIWQDVEVNWRKKYKKQEDLLNLICEHAGEVSESIRDILDKNGIPAKDHWSDGIEAIGKYCDQIHKELEILRSEKGK